MANVNKHTVPSNAIWAQTVIASLFALLAFIVLPSVGVGGQRGLGGVTPPTNGNPGGAWVFGVEDPAESSSRLLSCAAALAMNMASCSECS